MSGIAGITAHGPESNKELGIRKVLGASVCNIVTLLSTDFIVLVCIAFLIAKPDLPIIFDYENGWLPTITGYTFVGGCLEQRELWLYL